MNQTIKEVVINGETYVLKKDVAKVQGADTNGLPCVIVCAGIGGIHFGFLKHKNGAEVTLVNARRIQYWSGAASATEMATRGVSKPNDCRFSCAVSEIILPNAVEIINVSKQAQSNLESVPVWTR